MTTSFLDKFILITGGFIWFTALWHNLINNHRLCDLLTNTNITYSLQHHTEDRSVLIFKGVVRRIYFLWHKDSATHEHARRLSKCCVPVTSELGVTSSPTYRRSSWSLKKTCWSTRLLLAVVSTPCVVVHKYHMKNVIITMAAFL